VVHDAVQTLSGQTSRSLPTAATLICLLAALGACGGSSHPKTGAAGNTRSDAGESVRLASCSDWKRATIAQRREKVGELRAFAGGPVGSSAGIQHGPVLDDDRAYKLLQSYCANYFARGFKLYKLYTRAAAFVGH
jgi:homoserine acetyltransferase